MKMLEKFHPRLFFSCNRSTGCHMCAMTMVIFLDERFDAIFLAHMSRTFLEPGILGLTNNTWHGKRNRNGTNQKFMNWLNISCLCKIFQCAHFKRFFCETRTTYEIADCCKRLLRCFSTIKTPRLTIIVEFSTSCGHFWSFEKGIQISSPSYPRSHLSFFPGRLEIESRINPVFAQNIRTRVTTMDSHHLISVLSTLGCGARI